MDCQNATVAESLVKTVASHFYEASLIYKRVLLNIYKVRLQKLNLPTLLYQQTRMDLIMTYKILNNLVSMDKDYFFYC